MIFGASCPAPKPAGPPAPPPPKPKYVRYGDPKLQEAYARIVAALRTKSIAIYGKIFSEDEADEMARQAVDAVRALPDSSEIRQKVECLVEPIAAAGARQAVARLFLGAFVAGLIGTTSYVGWRAFRRRR